MTNTGSQITPQIVSALTTIISSTNPNALALNQVLNTTVEQLMQDGTITLLQQNYVAINACVMALNLVSAPVLASTSDVTDIQTALSDIQNYLDPVTSQVTAALNAISKSNNPQLADLNSVISNGTSTLYALQQITTNINGSASALGLTMPQLSESSGIADIQNVLVSIQNAITQNTQQSNFSQILGYLSSYIGGDQSIITQINNMQEQIDTLNNDIAHSLTVIAPQVQATQQTFYNQIQQSIKSDLTRLSSVFQTFNQDVTNNASDAQIQVDISALQNAINQISNDINSLSTGLPSTITSTLNGAINDILIINTIFSIISFINLGSINDKLNLKISQSQNGTVDPNKSEESNFNKIMLYINNPSKSLSDSLANINSALAQITKDLPSVTSAIPNSLASQITTDISNVNTAIQTLTNDLPNATSVQIQTDIQGLQVAAQKLSMDSKNIYTTLSADQVPPIVDLLHDIEILNITIVLMSANNQQNVNTQLISTNQALQTKLNMVESNAVSCAQTQQNSLSSVGSYITSVNSTTPPSISDQVNTIQKTFNTLSKDINNGISSIKIDFPSNLTFTPAQEDLYTKARQSIKNDLITITSAIFSVNNDVQNNTSFGQIGSDLQNLQNLLVTLGRDISSLLAIVPSSNTTTIIFFLDIGLGPILTTALNDLSYLQTTVSCAINTNNQAQISSLSNNQQYLTYGLVGMLLLALTGWGFYLASPKGLAKSANIEIKSNEKMSSDKTTSKNDQNKGNSQIVIQNPGQVNIGVDGGVPIISERIRTKN